MTEEHLLYVAAADNPSNDVRKRFPDVIPSNPSDIAGFAISCLEDKNQITLVSFGPTTKTTKSYMAGPSSVLSSLVSYYMDNESSVELYIESSSMRFPRNQDYIFEISSSNDLYELFKFIDKYDETDYIKITIFHENNAIVLLHLPSFPPFKSTTNVAVKINGWELLQNPTDLFQTTTYVVLHFDSELPDEDIALRALAFNPAKINVSSINKPINAIKPKEEPVEIAEKQSQIANTQEPKKKRPKKRIVKKRKPKKNLNITADDINVPSSDSENLEEEDIENISNNDIKQNKNHRDNKKKKQNQNKEKDKNQNSDDNDYSNFSDDNKDQQRKRDKSKKGKTQRKRKSLGSDTDLENALFDSSDQEQSNKKAKKNISKITGLPDDMEYDLSEEDYEGYTDELKSSSDAKSQKQFGNEDEEESSEEEDMDVEAVIRRFARSVEFTTPELNDTAIFSTMFQQLFFEKWKNGALGRARKAMEDARSHLRQLRSDEISNLKNLVQSNDLTVFIAREEQKLRLLESKSVDTLEELLNARFARYEGGSTPSLLRNFRAIVDEQIALQRRIREKRAAIRSVAMDTRIHQMKRLQAMERYHAAAAAMDELEAVAAEIADAEERRASVDAEIDGLEEDRDALAAQRDKVAALLDAKLRERANLPPK